MKIKITETNRAKILAALNEANGKATAHTYTHSKDVFDLADYAESRVVKIVGTKLAAVGAKVWDESGDELPNTYQNSRIVTVLGIERTSTGWFLTNVTTKTAWKEAGKITITLTPKQDTAAIANLRKQYQVFPALT